MKREQKSLTNKGFSLVELIIVVAIMAVLIGVLAPQYLRYVEKTRLQRDNSAIAEIANSIKIACTEEKVNQEVVAAGAAGKGVAFTTTATTTQTLDLTGTDALVAELAKTLGTKVELTSGTYTKSAAGVELTATADTNGTITIKAKNYISTPNGSADDTQPTF